MSVAEIDVAATPNTLPVTATTATGAAAAAAAAVTGEGGAAAVGALGTKFAAETRVVDDRSADEDDTERVSCWPCACGACCCCCCCC